MVLFLAQNIETTKFFFIKNALLKNKIIIIFVKLLHKSFVSWNKKVRWSTPLRPEDYISNTCKKAFDVAHSSDGNAVCLKDLNVLFPSEPL